MDDQPRKIAEFYFIIQLFEYPNGEIRRHPYFVNNGILVEPVILQLRSFL